MDGFDTLKGLGHDTNNFIRVYNILHSLMDLRFADPVIFCGLKTFANTSFLSLQIYAQNSLIQISSQFLASGTVLSYMALRSLLKYSYV
jgi:hypothetical protein